MPLNDFRSAYLPYCLDKQEDGSYAVLNREYKPLGFITKEFVTYSDYPVTVNLKGLTVNKAEQLSATGSNDTNRIYLYNDSTIPTDSKKNMDQYLSRLATLSKLKISDN